MLDWLLPIGILAACAFMFCVQYNERLARRLTLGAALVAGTCFTAAALIFLFQDAWVVTERIDLGRAVEVSRGRAMAVVIAAAVNVFLWLGPLGNAAVWGAAGLAFLRAAWTGSYVKLTARPQD